MKANPKSIDSGGPALIIQRSTLFLHAVFLLAAFLAAQPASAQQLLQMDWSDAPKPYPEVGHFIDKSFLGKVVDAETGAQPSDLADGDDQIIRTRPDDEDGVTLPASISPGETVDIPIQVTGGGFLNAWIDFNLDGDWEDAGEQIAVSKPVNIELVNVVTFTVPTTAKVGRSFARFRMSSNEKETSGGISESSGEVEDYLIEIKSKEFPMDFGDANDKYPVVLSQDGARHRIVDAFALGRVIDAEKDGQPSIDAKGDDSNPPTTGPDEDGVKFLTALVPGQNATVEVTLTGAQGGQLDAWIDFNGNGSWLDTTDKIFSARNLAPGANNLSFTVPSGSAAGSTYARFRLAFKGGMLPTGEADSGEVEDYLVRIEADQLDFGDAPPKYPVTLAQNGARHRTSRTVSLGAGVDVESDGQPSATASGDDSQPAGATDDEDGVTFAGPLEAGSIATISVVASVGQHRLDAWVDFNGDADWDDIGEKIFNSPVLAAGANTLQFPVPANAVLGQTAARFRLSAQGGLGPTGLAPDGEVEDYMVTVQQQALDFGDAPQSYPVLLSQDGARHSYQRDFNLGVRIDLEPDGQPSAGANGDDVNPFSTVAVLDDEDGVFFSGTGMVPGNSQSVIVVASTGQGRLDAWVDFNRDGDWNDTGEKIFNALALANGTNTLSFGVPIEAVPGDTFARFRFSTQGGLLPTGLGGPGEVEDHPVRINQLDIDYGDAAQIYPVTASQDGARHRVVKGFNLGRNIDSESNGQPSAQANGDDISPAGAADDEDGVAFITSINPGRSASVEVTSSSGEARLDAWIDFNVDGDWSDPGERIFNSQPLAAGPQVLVFNVPTDAKVGNSFARFRLSLRGGLDPTGLASEGEVEDYLINIDREVLDFGDAGQAYPVLLSQDGARHRILQGFNLGRLIDAEIDGQPSANSLGDDNNPAGTTALLDDEDGVRFIGPLELGREVTVEVVVTSTGMLDAWIDFNRNGGWNEAGEQIFTSRPVPTGTNLLTFTVPAGASQGETYARFRLSREGGLKPTGAHSDGEVEDYLVSIVERTGVDCDPRTHRGTNFWVTFPGNYAPDPDNPVRLRLYIVGPRETTGTVSIPGLGFITNYFIPGSRERIIDLPRNAELGNANDLVEKKGINITANREVAVYGMNRVKWTSDGYLALPTDVIGKAYVLQGYGNEFTGVPDLNGTQFGIVAPDDGTIVTITPRVSTLGHPAGLPFSVTLNRGETYQLRNTNDFANDLSGSVISANKSIAVFGSHQCANVPNDDLFYCDHLVEQILPIERAGSIFYIAPLATRDASAYRITVPYDNTTINFNGVNVATLNAGQILERVVSGPVRVMATKPVFVTQYATSSDYDEVVNSDPFMVVAIPVPMWLNQHLVTAPDMAFAEHYLSIVAPNSVVGGLTLDGAAVPAAQFAAIPGTAASYARLKVAAGVHELLASLPFSVVVYGWGEYDSYGFPGGMFFGDTEPPQLSCPDKVTATVGLGTTGAASCVAVVPDLRQQVTARDNCGLPRERVVSQDPAPGTVLGPGLHIITLSTPDAQGNVGFCQVQFEVIDPSPLQLQCPPDMFVNCNTNGGAYVDFKAIARRSCGTVDIPISYNPPAGSFFKDGTTTTVTVTAVDPRDNKTVTCTFRVTVRCGGQGAVLSAIKGADGKSFTLTWNANAVLEESATLAGDWKVVTAPQGSYTVVPTGKQSFYRLRLAE